jgi:peroxiredoxin
LVEPRHIHSKVVESGYQLIAISPDMPEKVRESIAKHELNFRLLSDSRMVGARALGVDRSLLLAALKQT